MGHRANSWLSSKRSQGGFSLLGAILVTVAIVGVLSVWTMSGQTNTSTAASSAADVMGSAIVNDASALKTAFDILLLNGSAVSSITFVPNTSGATNMLDPATGIQVPRPSVPSLYASPSALEGYWIYRPAGFRGRNTGTAADDQAVMLVGIKDAVCQQINKRIHGSTALPAFGAGVNSTAIGATRAAPVSSEPLRLDGWVAGNDVDQWTHGCMSTTSGADRNFYFRIVKVN